MGPHANMNTSIPEDKMASIREALFRGQKIEAIKLYRECTDAGLAEAKTAVEKLEVDLRVASPEKFTAPAPGRGCLGVIVMACLVVGAAILWIIR
jgi:hypothetical protein